VQAISLGLRELGIKNRANKVAIISETGPMGADRLCLPVALARLDVPMLPDPHRQQTEYICEIPSRSQRFCGRPSSLDKLSRRGRVCRGLKHMRGVRRRPPRPSGRRQNGARRARGDGKAAAPKHPVGSRRH